ncbi:hypothetical protein FRB90_007357 [Tulasnella sp. 427]|nr:hypothetical protein FRB90_007357 [Tulasnella sp. 427]
MSFQTVAVKKFNLDSSNLIKKAQTAAFANELGLLSEISHENIVKLHGFVEDSGEDIAWIVFPWESNGNLREFVQSQNWVIPERLSLIHDVACGIQYLHTQDPPICHGDLKSLNILVNSASHAIIRDFGSARKIDPNPKMKETKCATTSALSDPSTRGQSFASPQVQIGECGTFMTLTGPIYTLRWAAPEILQDDGFSLASDIWAFAWICWEIMTGSIPFADLNKHSSIVISVTQGRLPELTNNESTRHVQALCEMMSSCWEMSPVDRPTATNCVNITGRMGRIAPSYEGSYKRSDTRYVERLISLSNSNRENGMADEAMRCLQKALATIRVFNGKPAYGGWGGTIAAALWRLGKVYNTKGDYSKAVNAYIRAQKLFEGHDAEGNAADARRGLGDVYRLRGEFSKAEEQYLKAQDIFTCLGWTLRAGHAAWGLGEVYSLQGDYTRAEAAYTRAKGISENHGVEGNVAHARNGLGNVYRLKGKYSKAEEQYLKAQDIFTRLGWTLRAGNTAWRLGEVHVAQGDYTRAEEAYNRAKGIFEGHGAEGQVAAARNGLGDVYRLRGEYSKAEEHYLVAKEIFTRLGWASKVARADWGLGEVYRCQDNYSQAEEAYTRAKRIFEDHDAEGNVADARKGLGDVYRLRGEYSKAEEQYLLAKEIFTRLGWDRELESTLCALRIVYVAQEDHTKVYTARKNLIFGEAEEVYERIGEGDK